MGVEPDHEEEREVVRVPESLEALVANLMVGGRVHKDHDEEHEVASDASSLLVVDIKGSDWADLCRCRPISWCEKVNDVIDVRVRSTLKKLT